jgi:hypothetical protein
MFSPKISSGDNPQSNQHVMPNLADDFESRLQENRGNLPVGNAYDVNNRKRKADEELRDSSSAKHQHTESDGERGSQTEGFVTLSNLVILNKPVSPPDKDAFLLEATQMLKNQFDDWKAQKALNQDETAKASGKLLKFYANSPENTILHSGESIIAFYVRPGKLLPPLQIDEILSSKSNKKLYNIFDSFQTIFEFYENKGTILSIYPVLVAENDTLRLGSSKRIWRMNFSHHNIIKKSESPEWNPIKIFRTTKKGAVVRESDSKPSA